MELLDGEVVETLLVGQLKIIQNPSLYRFTSDSVLLSRFVRAKKGEVVADFCSGCGIVGIHFAALNPFVRSVTLFEMQSELCDMSRRTVELNQTENVTAVCCRVQDIGREYDGKFSLILANPPYERGGFEKDNEKVALCRKELSLSLPELLDAVKRKLKFGGRFAMCHRADRLAEILCAMKVRNIEPKRMQLVSGREGAKPYLLLVEGVLGGKEGMEILPQTANEGN